MYIYTLYQHDDSLGHFRFNKTYGSLWTSYYRPNMHQDLEAGYVASCPECQHNKSTTVKPICPYIHFQSQIKEATLLLLTSSARYQKMKGTTASSCSQTTLAVTYNLQQHIQTSQPSNWCTYFSISCIVKIDCHLTLLLIETSSSFPNSGRLYIE